jgi:hypothetical protein
MIPVLIKIPALLSTVSQNNKHITEKILFFLRIVSLKKIGENFIIRVPGYSRVSTEKNIEQLKIEKFGIFNCVAFFGSFF